MKRYSTMQPLYLAFYSRDLYRDVRMHWKGTGFLFLLTLLAVTWLPVMIMLHMNIAELVRKDASKYLEQVPKITIDHGKVSLDRPVPYTISNPDDRAPLMIIDTSGTITSFEQTTAPVVLTRDKLMYRKPDGTETRIYDLSRIETLVIDREVAGRWVRVFKKYFAVLAYPAALTVSFIYRVLQMLVYAAIGMLFVNMVGVTLDYLTVLRLASVSITPVIVLSTLLSLTGLHVRAGGLVYFSIAMGYLYFALKANAKPETPQTTAP